MESPDGQLRHRSVTPWVGAFTQPTQALAATGLQKAGIKLCLTERGSNCCATSQGRGLPARTSKRWCRGSAATHRSFRITCATWPANFSQSAANQGFIDALLTAGTSRSPVPPWKGGPSRASTSWPRFACHPTFPRCGSCIACMDDMAFAGREQEGENVLMRPSKLRKFSPEWEALQKSAGSPAVTRTARRRKIANVPRRRWSTTSGKLPR